MQIIDTGEHATVFMLNGTTTKLLHEKQKNKKNISNLDKEYILLSAFQNTNLPIPKNVKKPWFLR